MAWGEPTEKMLKFAKDIKQRFDLKDNVDKMSFDECRRFIGYYALAMRLPNAAHLMAMCAGDDSDFIALGPEKVD